MIPSPGARHAQRPAAAPEPIGPGADVLILRDPREARSKCSLTPLRGRAGIRFVDYRPGRRIAAAGRILLDPAGELLGPCDRGRGLLVIDCAWRRLPTLQRVLDGEPMPRRLPPLVTGYPRKSKCFADPGTGLASVEALFAALTLLGQEAHSLLAGYPWREVFLERNPSLRSRA